MSISDSKKLDFLWKKIIFGVSETDTVGKDGPNESISSPLPVYGSNVWSDVSGITDEPPIVDTPTVKVHRDTAGSAITLLPDPSVAGNKTWIAVFDSQGSISDPNNRAKDWIPPTFSSAYLVKVDGSGQKLNPLTDGEEWVFDYQAGVLHFPNDLPSGVNDIFIEGFRYIGPKGAGGSGGASSGGELAIQYVTSELEGGTVEEFELATGASAMMLELTVDGPCQVECHTTSTRDDPNPYRFVATSAHLSDDGTYVANAQRYHGPRFAHLHNLEDSASGVTYWKIVKVGAEAASITLDAKFLRLL